MADILSSSDQQDNVLEEDTSFDEKRPMYTSAERLLRLLHFLLANDCTRDAIFLHLADYYHIDDAGQPLSSTSRGAAERMLRRDILFLKKQGFHIHTTRATRSRPVRYQLVKGSGPSSIFLLNDAEVESLAFLYTLFADPNRYARIHQSQPLPLPPARNPFADDVLQLIEKFSAMLPEAQRKLFNRSIEKPFVYFQMAPVTDFFRIVQSSIPLCARLLCASRFSLPILPRMEASRQPFTSMLIPIMSFIWRNISI